MFDSFNRSTRVDPIGPFPFLNATQHADKATLIDHCFAVRARDWRRSPSERLASKPRRQRPIEPSSSQHQKQSEPKRKRIPAKGPPPSRPNPPSHSSSPSSFPSPSAFSTSTSFFPFPKFGKTGAFATFFPLRCFFLALSSSTSSSTSSS